MKSKVIAEDQPGEESILISDIWLQKYCSLKCVVSSVWFVEEVGMNKKLDILEREMETDAHGL